MAERALPAERALVRVFVAARAVFRAELGKLVFAPWSGRATVVNSSPVATWHFTQSSPACPASERKACVGMVKRQALGEVSGGGGRPSTWRRRSHDRTALNARSCGIRRRTRLRPARTCKPRLFARAAGARELARAVALVVRKLGVFAREREARLGMIEIDGPLGENAPAAVAVAFRAGFLLQGRRERLQMRAGMADHAVLLWKLIPVVDARGDGRLGRVRQAGFCRPARPACGTSRI